MYPHYVLSKNKKHNTLFHLKIDVFTAVKYRSILHRHVFVMKPIEPNFYVVNLGLQGKESKRQGTIIRLSTVRIHLLYLQPTV